MTYTLHLAHINDTHSHFEPSLLHFDIKVNNIDYRLDVHCGGYANIATAVQTLRSKAKQRNQSSLFLHAGDSFQGSLYFSCFKGAANAILLNCLQPDAMTIGNHEFDLGNTPIADFLKRVSFPVLAGNMDLSQEDQLKAAPLKPHDNLYFYDHHRKIANYLIKPLLSHNIDGDGDKQLAIIGITLDLMAQIGCPDPDCHFVDAVATTRNTVAHLHQQGIKHIVVLSHLGYQGDKHLAQAVDGISVIVGGHSHTLSGDFSALNIASTGCADERINNTLILHGGQHAESIGCCELDFDEHGTVTKFGGGVSFLINDDWQASQNEQPVNALEHQAISAFIKRSHCFNRVTADNDINQLISERYRPAVDEMRSLVVTTIPTPLTHTRLPTADLPFGSEIAPLVAQGFYHAALRDKSVDFGLHNAGGVRVSIKAGQLTQAEICGRLLPFAIAIISYVVTGQVLKQALEGAINNAISNGVKGTGNGSYPYTHFLRFEYQAAQPRGQRITALEIWRNNLWLPVADSEQYRGVSSGYTLAGKEGYDALLESSDHFDHQVTMADAFIDFIGNADLPITISANNSLIL
jgi:5'-nucleotidase